jgi:hypothetical protein
MNHSGFAVNDARKASDKDIQERMPYGAEIVESDGLCLSSLALLSCNRDFDIGSPSVKEASNQICLEAETVGVGIPAHDIAALEDWETIVIVKMVAANSVNDEGIDF